MSNSLLHQILKLGIGNTSCRFANADGKVWIMPTRNMRTAMNLYQPSGMKGKLVKRWFPLLSWSSIVRRVVHAERVRYALCTDLQQLLTRILGLSEFEFSVFGGTPCVHQKITIQLSRGKRILGYCKLSDNAEIIALFHREADTLNSLAKRGLTDCIPQAMYCGELGDGIGVFVQSTTKTNDSKVIHEWGAMQKEFMSRLQAATQRCLPFEESDYQYTLIDLREHLNWLPKEINRELIERTLEKVCSQYTGKEVTFSAYHADFTPWNMFVEGGKLFVFDWEYMQMTYPSGLDRYHFFTQTAIFEKHWGAKEIIRFMNSEGGEWMDKDCYTLYLLEIISRFTRREKGDVKGDMLMSFGIWNALLEYLQQ